MGCVFADVFNRGRFDLLVSTDSWLSGANYTEPQLLQQKHTVEPNLLDSIMQIFDRQLNIGIANQNAAAERLE